jgi:MoaA/NifB/PqqE/SkfB family radical SAM enzyme
MAFMPPSRYQTRDWYDPPVVPFPAVLSATVTNACNLRCRMCAQWGPEGYILGGKPQEAMPVSRWIELVNEAGRLGTKVVCLRGGEPLLFPGVLEIIRRIKARGLFLCMDTNGVFLGKVAEELVDTGIDVITVSVDGPEAVHDRVRGVPGTFQAMAGGVRAVHEAKARTGSRAPEMGACFTMSPESLPGLAGMGDVMRTLGLPTISANPYYYFPEKTGRVYEERMKGELGCEAYSWRGFHREGSGVDPEAFLETWHAFKAGLGDVRLYPFMDFTDDDFLAWFSDNETPVGRRECPNPVRLLDIQPGGDANFCVDFPDYVIGNVAARSIEEVWNGERAQAFRRAVAAAPFPVCFRCGATYMS